MNNQIRKENQEFNNKRINEANSEGELWKITDDVVKPRMNEAIKLNIKGHYIKQLKIQSLNFASTIQITNGNYGLRT